VIFKYFLLLINNKIYEIIDENSKIIYDFAKVYGFKNI